MFFVKLDFDLIIVQNGQFSSKEAQLLNAKNVSVFLQRRSSILRKGSLISRLKTRLQATGPPCYLVGPFHFVRNDLNLLKYKYRGFIRRHPRFSCPSLEEARWSSEDACLTAIGSPCWLVCSFQLAGNNTTHLNLIQN